jgi:hypothetical protein
MTIGRDIASVLSEVGTTIRIERPGVATFTEKVDVSMPSRVSHPFIREFLAEASLPNTTRMLAGDIFQILISNRFYMIMSLVPEYFEDEITEYGAYLYKCNKMALCLVMVEDEQWNARYQKTPRWVAAYEKLVPVLMYDKQAFDRAITLKEEWSNFAMTSNELYISGHYKMPPLSRIRLFETTVTEYEFWDQYISYPLQKIILSDDFRAFQSLIVNNLGNDPCESLDELDEYSVEAWMEIPYRDIKVERVDLSRFENVLVYNATEDLR